MGDGNPNDAGGQAPDGAQSGQTPPGEQGGQTPPQDRTSDQDQDQDRSRDDDRDDDDESIRQIRKLRREARDRRKEVESRNNRVAELEATVRRLEGKRGDEDRSREDDSLRRELEEERRKREHAERDALNARTERRLEGMLEELGVSDTEAALALLDHEEIDVDDRGVPDRADVKAQVKRLLKRRPWLGKQTTSSGSSDEEQGSQDGGGGQFAGLFGASSPTNPARSSQDSARDQASVPFGSRIKRVKWKSGKQI